MALILEKRSHCSFGEERISPFCSKYDLDLWKSLLVDYEELSVVELKANMGRQIVSKLPVRFRKENRGRFIAVTFTGKVLVVSDTLEALNKEIAKKNMKENYYIERIGYESIAQI